MTSVSNVLAMGQMQVAIARKELDAIEQQGKQALTLIQAAAPAQNSPAANAAAGVGGQLNIVA
jgi:hypothetical protein